MYSKARVDVVDVRSEVRLDDAIIGLLLQLPEGGASGDDILAVDVLRGACSNTGAAESERRA